MNTDDVACIAERDWCSGKKNSISGCCIWKWMEICKTCGAKTANGEATTPW